MGSPQHSRRDVTRAAAVGLATLAGAGGLVPDGAAQSATPEAAPAGDITTLSAAEIQTIAEQAFIYGFPMVENYKTLYAYAIEVGSPQYKAPFNTLSNTARVYTPADTTVVTPNSDTPYSFVILDLRAEPVVLTVPPIEKDRYFSWQTFDLYTYLAPYIGSRTTGNSGGTFLFTGPDWRGETPDGITQVLPLPTGLGLTLGRTQLFDPDDLEQVIKIQNGYKAQPLSAFLGQPAPAPAPEVDWLPYDATSAMGLGFFAYLNFLLSFAPVLPEDQPIRDLLAKIGVVPGQPFDLDALSPEIHAALQAGLDAANTTINLEVGAIPNANELFGSRDFLQGRYLDRAAGARYGIYGNAAQEAMYLGYRTDALGQPLTGSGPGYTLTFAKGELPPVNAFWSLTVYDGTTQLLVANPINRYLINSPMLPTLAKDADGGVMLYLQHDAPSSDLEANWLPVPDGPFYGVLRLYWPQDAALSGMWQAPALQPAH